MSRVGVCGSSSCRGRPPHLRWMRVAAKGVSGRDGPLTALGAEVRRVAVAVVETEAARQRRSRWQGCVRHVFIFFLSAVGLGGAGGCQAGPGGLFEPAGSVVGRVCARIRQCTEGVAPG
ncbi:hypothetical protein NDU88_006097 [Pleurodeles waltl]|uniref:Uncharacterized protein n=1 Tax=Pleurodeles waltl TaxID=8319 RepID=A0AAV7VLX1_PLEWA|nr:hypothetical protein NDU88_006097 [Pleurodeles waltl]